MTKLSTIISSCVGLFVLIGAGVTCNEYFAKAAELQMVVMRLDQKILQDEYNWKEQRLYIIEDRWREKKMPQTVMEEYRKLKNELRLIEKKLKF